MARETIPADPPASPALLRRRLLDWYARSARRLAWRAAAGARPDPYAVWISEIMLQQTTTKAVGPYYQRFLARWPDVESLARADLDDVLHAWQGLGYYARARNLHRAAKAVAASGGRLPESEADLRALPGIGAYTAAAIAAIAFDRPAVVVDANVERVIARLFALETPLPKAKRALHARAALLAPQARAGDYAQALMDLGATICTPKRPACVLCPWARHCRGRDRAEALPARAPKRARPLRHAIAFWVARRDGAVLLRRRAENGLLGGMIELPSTEWRARTWSAAEAIRTAPLALRFRAVAGTLAHGFTHFELEMGLMRASAGADENAPAGCFWWPVARLGDLALSTLAKKVVAFAGSGRPARRR